MVGGFEHIDVVTIGGDSPVVVQTMWKDRLLFEDLETAARRIAGLSAMGCRLVRFAVPDIAAAETVGRLAHMVSMPLVADIHFDYQIALRCMDFPIAKIRINPGNIGSTEKTRTVLEKAAAKNVPIRIGLNAGSLPQDLRLKGAPGMNCADALVEAALRELAIFEKLGFSNVLVSMKASGIADTIRANRLLAAQTNVPLHIGVTEAGPLVAGIARSSAALTPLLAQGIGDTLRVSLSDTMENEVIAAREICQAAAELALASSAAASCNAELASLSDNDRVASRLTRDGVTIVSCPRCGRYGFDTHGFSARWLPRLYALDKKLTIAIMGCEVNGPEEARHADLGITGSGNKVLLFRRGKIVRTVTAAQADAAFTEELALMGASDTGEALH